MYGAMFYGGAGMMAIYCLVAVAMFLPGLFAGDLSLASFSREIVQLAIWTLVAVATYALTGHLRQISRTDALTGLINHGAFWEQAQAEHERSERHGRPYTVLLADIDHFKRTNDAYGHRTGDRVLNEVAQVLSSRVRTGDIVARYGGEEFAVLLPETGADDARSVAEELRRQVAAKVVSPSATLSIGLASNEGDAAGRDLDSVVQAADAAMYEAKGGGRNRVRGGYVKSQ
jgi:diguanylate cyclase (GGDEF)-like protein